MPHIKANSNIEWHYQMEGEGECLLFIHGWGVDGRIWRQQTKHFADNFKVIAIDLPGHGKSGWHSVTLSDMSKDIYFILNELNIKRVVLIGSSLGGLLALKYYEMFPQGVKDMIMVGSMPKFSKSEDYPYGLDIERMRKLEHQVEDAYPSIVHIFFRSLFTKEERQTRRYKWLQKFRKYDIVPIKPALVEYLDILEREDLRNVLKDAPIPIQFINGAGDEICCQDTVGYLKSVRPNDKFYEFEHCGHFPFLSKAHEFNTILEEILK
ncbi:MAG: alpha/beta hydrolase [Candidatus Omnitrophica bacterium]|nr:alpha/beta hydrolase [Candidatus Omnitrophota bacterium]